MISLALGLIAAIAWGIHDVCVRYVSQHSGVIAPMLTVLTLGSFVAVPVALVFSHEAMTQSEILIAIAAGAAFAVAGYALYQAFSIGPVRLVAPIIGAYPILSVGWAAISGTTVTTGQWIAIMLVIAGVGFVAGSTGPTNGPSEQTTHKADAIKWSLLACVGFALSFALAHQATRIGTEFSVNAVSRVTAVTCVFMFALINRAPMLPNWGQIKILSLMGILDCAALGAVVYAGTQANPEYSSVAASSFGMITVILASLFLREQMALRQWAGVAVVFSAIAYLAF